MFKISIPTLVVELCQDLFLFDNLGVSANCQPIYQREERKEKFLIIGDKIASPGGIVGKVKSSSLCSDTKAQT